MPGRHKHRGYKMRPVTGRLRVTVAQKAWVCALILADHTYAEACAVAGIGTKVMSEYLPKEWRGKASRPRVWFGERLAALEESYNDYSLSLSQIGRLHVISQQNICKLAQINGWPRRIDRLAAKRRHRAREATRYARAITRDHQAGAR